MPDREHARIRLYWGSAEKGMYGETRPIAFEGHLGAEVFVRPSPLPVNGDRLLRDAIVYPVSYTHLDVYKRQSSCWFTS